MSSWIHRAIVKKRDGRSGMAEGPGAVAGAEEPTGTKYVCPGRRVGCWASEGRPRSTGRTRGSGMSTGYVELARAQQERWQTAYTANASLHGAEPSVAARGMVQPFKVAGIDDVLELGAGQGRDALFLA